MLCFFNISFENWLKFIFNHPPNDRRWYWDNSEAKKIANEEYNSFLFAQYIKKLFNNPRVLQNEYSLDQINNGLWFIHTHGFYNRIVGKDEVGIDLSIEIIQATFNLFKKLFAGKAWNDKYKGKENKEGVCYMWFDLCMGGDFEEEYFRLICKILLLPSKSCQYSALHGLGELIDNMSNAGIFKRTPEENRNYQKKAKASNKKYISVIDRFLKSKPFLDEDLRNYAEQAKLGNV